MTVLRNIGICKEQATAEPALFALAEIADTGAVQALAEAQRKTSGALRLAAAAAYLKAADRRFERGDAQGSVRIYRELYAAGEPNAVRAKHYGDSRRLTVPIDTRADASTTQNDP